MSIVISVGEAREKYIREANSKLDLGNVSNHASIYKYVSLDGVRSWNYFEKMFAESKLVGATLNSLNDPFEGKPRLFDDLSDEKISESCKYFDKNGEEVDVLSDYNDLAEIRSKTQTALSRLFSNVRILSFCRRSDSHLLWSHYANSHKGACIHFSAGGFTHKRLTKGSVSYNSYRPVVPLSLATRIAVARTGNQHPADRLALRRELYHAAFFVKPLDWSYEDEVRILYSKGWASNAPFEKASIYEVIVGARTEDDDVERIRTLVNRFSPRTKIRRATISKDTFSVSIER